MKSSSPQMPIEDTNIIYAVSTSLMIIEGSGKKVVYSIIPSNLPEWPHLFPRRNVQMA
jgi:hypothetical protein